MAKRSASPVAGAVPVRARGEAPAWLQARRARAAARNSGESLAAPLPGRYMATGFRAVTIAGNEGRSYSEKSADVRQEFDRATLVAESRTHFHDNALYRGVIGRLVDNVVGNGFGLQVTGGSEAQNKALEDNWKVFWRRPEIRGLWTGAEVERQAITEVAVAGDVGFIKTNRGLLQAIESERISHGDGKTGVEMTAEGRVTSYWVRDYGATGTTLASTEKPIAAAHMIFLANLDRFSATRGMPALVPALPMFHRINDVCDSNALAWQLLSRMAIKITADRAPEEAHLGSRIDSSAQATSTQYDLAARVQDLGYALAFHGKPGENIEGIERNIPQQNFMDSLRAFLRVTGLPLGMPLELILLDWSQSNYSAARAALEQAWVTFRVWQAKLSWFLDQVIGWKIAEWTASGAISAPADGFTINWIAPSFPWLDQLKEAEAWASKLDRGLETQARAIKSLGNDPDVILEAREKEIRDAIKRADGIEKDFPKRKVPYEYFCGLAAKGAEAPAGRPGKPAAPSTPPSPSMPSDGSDQSDKESENEA